MKLVTHRKFFDREIEIDYYVFAPFQMHFQLTKHHRIAIFVLQYPTA